MFHFLHLVFLPDNRYHFIRSANRQANYGHSESGRLFLTIPYTGPQIGAEYQVELLSFMCFNSCGHTSHSKRRIDVIFTLENKYVLVSFTYMFWVICYLLYNLKSVKNTYGEVSFL